MLVVVFVMALAWLELLIDRLAVDVFSSKGSLMISLVTDSGGSASRLQASLICSSLSGVLQAIR